MQFYFDIQECSLAFTHITFSPGMNIVFKKPYTARKQKRGGLSNRLKQLLERKTALEFEFDNEKNKLLFEIDRLQNQIIEKNEKKIEIQKVDKTDNAVISTFKLELKLASDICLKTFESVINI